MIDVFTHLPPFIVIQVRILLKCDLGVRQTKHSKTSDAFLMGWHIAYYCAPKSHKLTGGGPGFDAGNLGIGHVCVDLCRFTGLFQQVPHLNVAILFPNEENSWSGQGPASHSAHLLRARWHDDGAILEVIKVK